jgi:hypothetical protein
VGTALRAGFLAPVRPSWSPLACAASTAATIAAGSPSSTLAAISILPRSSSSVASAMMQSGQPQRRAWAVMLPPAHKAAAEVATG